ncbi:hypothetical protein [Azospirillum sp. SYSU D00513]|uniref:hypothetical protein n=1 Tax=Azospirillum sp. SYSU D00513 TaxID=2812561 RepID=UPI001A95CDC2|nr:hypothetical protein [Azospirillum sp. SYSU D00513]
MVIGLPTSLNEPVCCHCGKPIAPGQPRWAGDPEERPWHYACAEEAGRSTKASERFWTLRNGK